MSDSSIRLSPIEEEVLARPAPVQEPPSEGLLSPLEEEVLSQRPSPREEANFLEMLSFAAETNPDRAAEAREMAKTLNISQSAALQDPQVLRGVFARRMAEIAEIEKQSPALAEAMRSWEFATIAHDDIDHLGFIEGLIGSFTAGRKQVELGAVGQRRRTEGDTPELLAESRRLRRDLWALPQEGGFFWGTSTWLGQMSQMAPEAIKEGALAGSAVGMAAAAAGPAAPISVPAGFVGGFFSGATASLMAQNFRTEAGLSFDQLVRAGYNVGDARLASEVVGWSSTALEAAGTVAQIGRPLLAPIKAALRKRAGEAFVEQTLSKAVWETAKSYGLGIAGEGAAEGLTQVVQVLAEDWAAKRATNPNAAPSALMEGKAWEQIVQATVAGAQVAAALGVLPEFANLQHRLAGAKQAEATQKFLRQATETAGKSKLLERAPDAAHEHFERLFQNGPAENLYFDARAVGDALRQIDQASTAAGKIEKSAFESFAETFPGVAEQLNQPGAEDRDIVIKTADFVAAAKQPIVQELMPHARTDAAEPSFADVQEARNNAEADLEEIGKKVEQRIEESEAFRESGDRLQVRLEQEIRKAAPAAVSNLQVKTATTVARRFYDQLGRITGKLPEDLPRIGYESGELETDLAQPNWTEPGELAHGSPRELSTLRAGSMLTSNPSWAAGYATRTIDGNIDREQFFGYVYVVSWKPSNPVKPEGVRFLPDVESWMISEGKKFGISDAEGSPIRTFGLQGLAKELHKVTGYDAIVAQDGTMIPLVDVPVARRMDPASVIREAKKRGALVAENVIKLVADDDALRQPRRGGFDVKRLTAILGSKADVSTILHEMFHGYMETLIALAEDTSAPSEIHDMLDLAYAHLGMDGRSKRAGHSRHTIEWRKLSPEERRKHHENLAYNFEVWLEEGKAPTLELQTLFERIAAWMRNVYKDIRGFLNDRYREEFGTDLPALTPELRDFFDRMLASEDQIAQTEAVRGRMAAFQSREEFPGTDAEWREWQALVTAQREGGIHKLNQSMLKELTWLGREKMRVGREVKNDVRKLRERAAKEAEAEVSQRPVYVLRAAMKSDKSVRLNAADLLSTFGVETHDITTALGGWVVSAKEGFELDFLAEYYGFFDAASAPWGATSGENMVRALLDAPAIKDAIAVRTDEIMLRDHSELATREGQLLAIENALNTEASSRLTAAAIRFLTKSKTPDRKTVAAARETARLRLQNTPVDSIKARSFSVAAVKAGQRAALALKGKRQSAAKSGVVRPAVDPSPLEAVHELRQQLVLEEMARQAVEIERDITKAKKFFSRVFAKEDTTAKARNFDLVLAARAILSTWGYGSGTKMPEEHLQKVAAYNPDVYARLEPLLRRATEGWEKTESMTWKQFQEMQDAVKSLWEMADRVNKIEVNGKLEDRQAAVDVMVAQVTEVLGTSGPVGPITADTRNKVRFSSIKATATRVEAWLRKADGGKADGPLQKYLFRSLRQAFDRYMADRSRYVKRLHTIVKKLRTDGLMDGGKIAAPELVNADGKPTVFDSMAHLLGAMLHMGNRSNLRKLLMGYGWATESENPLTGEMILDTRKWDEFVARMYASGKVQKAHIDALQAIWNLNAELKPLAQKTNRDAYGRYFEEVQAQKFMTPWGEYEGGYAPAPPDTDHMLVKQRLKEVAADSDDPVGDLERDFQSVWPVPPKGFTIERTGATLPIQLDLNLQVRHFDQVLRFIHLQMPLRDTLSLIHDEKMTAALEGASPGVIEAMFMPWLRAVATNRIVAPGMHKVSDSVLNFLKRSAGLAFMTLNVTNALQQFTGVLNVLPLVPRSHVWSAFRKVREMGITGAREFVVSQSDAMRVRFDEHFGNVTTDFDLALDPSRWGEVKRHVDKWGYYLQAQTQHATDVVAWLAAYDHAVSTGRGQELAVQDADSVVRLSQGSRTTIDTSKLERGSPVMQLLLQFGGYYITVLNQVMGAQADAKVRTAVLAMVLPTFIAAAISSTIRGAKGQNDFDDKDEDGAYWDDWAWWLFKGQARGALAMVPVAGPVASQWVVGDRSFADRTSIAPILSLVDGLGSTIKTYRDRAFALTQGQEQFPYSRAEFENLLLAFSLSGIPLTPIRDAGRLVQ